MIDTTPYIIVDNQKILPVSRTPQSASVSGDPESREKKDFGVVDRVTISSQARQKYRQAQFDTAPPPNPHHLAMNPPSAHSAMLTYTPEKLH